MVRTILLSLILFSSRISFGQTNVQASSELILGLPFKEGKTRIVTQGYFGKYSHQGEHAIDFRLRKGEAVFAAREGIVFDLKEDEDRNFWKGVKSYRANYVILKHDDGTFTKYMHMQKDGVLVNVGDTIIKGQLIAEAGSTGNSTMSHLHLVCYKINNQGQKETFPTLFETKKGDLELKAWHIYRKPKQVQKN
jgi:murein DD-endopeptidase MepM/ murein hydrolase activator NlpD